MVEEPPSIAVLDIGKTNLKLVIATEDGWPLDSLVAPNRASQSGPYLAYDLGALEAWFLDALTIMARRHKIGAIIATAHGCGAVLVADGAPVLPMMDYEAQTPPEIDALYETLAPPYREVFCSNGAGAMRLAKQLLWQERDFPDAFAKADMYLTTAQYFAMRLGGRPASEISQLAAQGHVWDAAKNQPASLLRVRGWSRLLPPRAAAGAVLGRLSPALAARTGLSRETEILCGVHDSNANLARYSAAGLGDASILSTGTWMIGFQRSKAEPAAALAALDPARAMVLNLDVDGALVPSTLTMTGREYATIKGEFEAEEAEIFAGLLPLLAQNRLPIGAFAADPGFFPGSGGKGRILGGEPLEAADRHGLAVLYAAFNAHFALNLLGSQGEIIIDGGFAANRPFARILAALRPGQTVKTSRSGEGTALGAALLWKRFSRKLPVQSVELEAMRPAGNADAFAQAFNSWQILSEEGSGSC